MDSEGDTGGRGGSIPNPSSLKVFPFMTQRSWQSGNPMDKFSSVMDPRCVRAFAVFGPLRCLHSAFPSFQESNYRAMFQQIFPSLVHVKSRIQDGAFLFRLEPGYSGLAADFVLRTISKKALEEFKGEHDEIFWDNPDKEALANEVFDTIPPENVRYDAVIDCKTDSVKDWNVKTRMELASYGNQLCLENLQNGFSPRPVYLIAIDATRWRLSVLDPYGVISVNPSGCIDGFASFAKQQKLRAEWIRKKDPDRVGYFAKTRPWTEENLQDRLENVNKLLTDKGNISGVKAGKYVVSNIWNAREVFLWNGSGLDGKLLDGSLVLCEGLLRLACGDRVCKDGWTAQKLRMVFKRQHDEEINRCLQFESAFTNSQARSLACSYSENVIAAAVADMEAMTRVPADGFRHGFIDSIETVRGCLREMARVPSTASHFLTVIQLIQFAYSLQNDIAEDDAVECFDALVISVERVLKSFNQEMAYARLVVFAKNVDKGHMLKNVKSNIAILKVRNESLNALRTYLGVELVDNQKADFISCRGRANKLVMCRNEVIVYRSGNVSENQPLSSVLELRVSGATRDHFHERVGRMQKAATAINSSIAKGLIAGGARTVTFHLQIFGGRSLQSKDFPAELGDRVWHRSGTRRSRSFGIGGGDAGGAGKALPLLPLGAPQEVKTR
ncbi:hypothetical protein SELMODRAFT_402960 [Selaginella moellendorffii]|uniref:Uncharacterized protein n=1 Tax=Selaginella moellendorffii TaxID=88036 RepID=D8QNL1_SELML|nr:hypothetical protein SELMODRAFT_402960 [Selaginella moellendorffii]